MATLTPPPHPLQLPFNIFPNYCWLLIKIIRTGTNPCALLYQFVQISPSCYKPYFRNDGVDLKRKKKTKLPYSFDSLKQSLYIQNPWSQRNAEHWSHVIICESHSFITKMSFSNIITQHIKGRFEKESFNDWRTCVYKSTWWIFSF